MQEFGMLLVLFRYAESIPHLFISEFICQHIVYHHGGTISRYILIVSMGIIVGLDTETDVSD